MVVAHGGGRRDCHARRAADSSRAPSVTRLLPWGEKAGFVPSMPRNSSTSSLHIVAQPGRNGVASSASRMSIPPPGAIADERAEEREVVAAISVVEIAGGDGDVDCHARGFRLRGDSRPRRTANPISLSCSSLEGEGDGAGGIPSIPHDLFTTGSSTTRGFVNSPDTPGAY